MPKFEEYPEKTSLDAADLIVTRDSVDGQTKHVRADNAGIGGGGGAGSLVFQWNGQDLTQFDTANGWIDDDPSNGRVAGIGMSVEASGREGLHGNRLVMEPTSYSGGADGSGIILANDPLPSHDLLFELDVWDHDVNAFGLVVFADYDGVSDIQATLNCWAFGLINTIQFRVDDGDVAPAGAPNYGSSVEAAVLSTNQQALIRCRVKGFKPSGASPRGSMYAEALRDNGQKGHFNFGNFPEDPPPASWDNLSMLKWGFMQYAAGGSTAGPTRLLDVRIYDMAP